MIFEIMILLQTDPLNSRVAHFVEHLAFGQLRERTNILKQGQIIANTSPFQLTIKAKSTQLKLMSQNIQNISYFDYILELPQIKYEMSQISKKDLAQERNLQQLIGGNDIAFPCTYQLVKQNQFGKLHKIQKKQPSLSIQNKGNGQFIVGKITQSQGFQIGNFFFKQECNESQQSKFAAKQFITEI